MKKLNFLSSFLICGMMAIPSMAQLYTAPIGVQAYSFRYSFPKGVAATLDSIQAMGITELEGGEGYLTPVEFKKLCDARGISIPSSGASFDELRDNPAAVAKRALALGSKFVMCAWVPHGKTFTLEDANKAIAVFNKAGKVLRDQGIAFCYHPHGYEFYPYEGGTLLDYIITSTSPENVSFELDILWAHFGGGDPAGLLRKYGNRFKLMHVKDLRKGTPKDLTGGTSQQNDVTLGTGELNIPEILREARKVGIAHYFIEDESSRVNTQVPLSIRYLRSLQ